MATAARRISNRLSGGSNASNSPSNEIRQANGGVKRRSTEGVDMMNNGAGRSQQGLVESKRQKTGSTATFSKNTNQSTFNPGPLPRDDTSSESSDQPPQPPPPPPPPSELRTARKRSSVRAMIDDDELIPSPPPRLATNRNADRLAPVVTVGGLEDVSLDAELGAERGRWQDMVNDNALPNGTTSKNSSLPLLDFLFSSAPKPKVGLEKPDTPPRNATLSVYTTPAPSARSRRVSSVHGRNMLGEGMSESVVPLQIGDTPQMKRNQQMRKEASKRTSLGMRGQRMSESLSRGDIAAPHHSIPSETFYKHISPNMPETMRTRHLIMFAMQRAVRHDKKAGESLSKSRSKGKGKEVAHTAEGDAMINAIMGDVFSQLRDGKIDTNVFLKAGEAKSVEGIRPHPRNVANKEEQVKMEGYIEKTKQEEMQWQKVIRQINARLKRCLDRQEQGLSMDDQPDLDSMDRELADTLRGWIELAQAAKSDLGAEIAALGEGEVEYNIDTAYQGSYTALQYSQTTSRFLDGIFSSLSQDLRNRERIGGHPPMEVDPSNPTEAAMLSAIRSASSSALPPPSNPMNMLRALASAEAKEQRDSVLAAASALPPVPPPGASTSTSQAGPNSHAMTPRRGLTPRRGVSSATTPSRLRPGSSRFGGGSGRHGDHSVSPGA